MIDAPATWALAEVVNNMSDPIARTTEPAVDRRGKLLRPTPSRTIQQLLATLLTLLPRLKSRELRVATAPWNGNGFINGDSFVLGGTFLSRIIVRQQISKIKADSVLALAWFLPKRRRPSRGREQKTGLVVKYINLAFWLAETATQTPAAGPIEITAQECG
jgi:hypothetical protein